MSDGDTLLMAVLVAVAALAMLSLAALRGWEGWLRLRRTELAEGRGPRRVPPRRGAERLELADLKDRVRRLESIASGMEH